MFGDQFPNAARIAARGVGLLVEKNELLHLPNALNEMLTNDRLALTLECVLQLEHIIVATAVVCTK